MVKMYCSVVMSCCNGTMPNPYGAYVSHDLQVANVKPKIKAYSGWASYKNAKSGNYNRQLCDNCSDFKGFPQAAGVYDLNINDSAPAIPNYRAMAAANRQYQVYQAARLSNNPGSYRGKHVNYLNEECGFLYPKRYVKGYWPDEYLIYTNTPAGGCHTAPESANLCSNASMP